MTLAQILMARFLHYLRLQPQFTEYCGGSLAVGR
jgi:hypothetical protein